MDPLDALQRIAYRLERGGADTYKVRAFRHAAGRSTHAADELAALAQAGRLQTSRASASRRPRSSPRRSTGGCPTTWPSSRRVDPTTWSSTAAARSSSGRSAGDCHSHSDWSDGGSPILEMAEAARDLGHEYLVLTDHSARLTVAHGLDAERLRRSSKWWPS